MRSRLTLLIAAVGLTVTPVLGGIFENMYRGLGIYATPSGSPIGFASGGGQVNGARYGRLRIVPVEYGDGYRLELDRNFGVDSRGRSEVFDFGSFELELNGSTQATAQYTNNGIPAVNLDVFANTLNYSIREKTGAQDLELIGTLNVSNQFEINRFGFYTAQVQIDNTNAALLADGVAVDGDLDTDFNVGPISIEGNVFYDIALAALTAFGADTSELEAVFPSSPIDRINDEIEEALRGQAAVLGDSYTMEFPEDAFEDDAGLDAPPTEDDGGTVAQVPEPASALLLAVLAGLGLRRRG